MRDTGDYYPEQTKVVHLIIPEKTGATERQVLLDGIKDMYCLISYRLYNSDVPGGTEKVVTPEIYYRLHERWLVGESASRNSEKGKTLK